MRPLSRLEILQDLLEAHVCTWPKPGPENQCGNNATLDEGVGCDQRDRGIQRKPAMRETVYERNDTRIEEIQDSLRASAFRRLVLRSRVWAKRLIAAVVKSTAWTSECNAQAPYWTGCAERAAHRLRDNPVANKTAAIVSHPA